MYCLDLRRVEMYVCGKQLHEIKVVVQPPLAEKVLSSFEEKDVLILTNVVLVRLCYYYIG